MVGLAVAGPVAALARGRPHLVLAHRGGLAVGHGLRTADGWRRPLWGVARWARRDTTSWSSATPPGW